ncbi:MAG: substrate-binding domain-containing protein [Rhodospirillales bacterium]|nr:MAG: substrate-binding domain-containing protein [Rhodospirillales bacterium]
MADKTATIRVLSAGAPKGGVSACAEAFTRKTGHKVDIVFATAPVLRGRVEGGETGADIVIAPPAAMDAFATAGLIAAAPRVPVGAVRAGVAIRRGATRPDLSSVEGFKKSLLAAESLVHNEASSGQYIALLIERLGLSEALAEKTVVVPNGAAVIAHLQKSTRAYEIGFSQVPEISRFEDEGIELAGPLPEEIGKTTRYEAGLLADAAAPEAARALLQFMASPEAAQLRAEAGLE